MHSMVPAEQHRHIPTGTSYVFDGTKRRPRTELPADNNKRDVRTGEIFPGVFLTGELVVMPAPQAEIVQGSSWAQTEILVSETAKRDVLKRNHEKEKMEIGKFPRLYLTMVNEDSHGLYPYTKEIYNEAVKNLSKIVNPTIISFARPLYRADSDLVHDEKMDELTYLLSGVRGLHWDVKIATLEERLENLVKKLDARMRTNWRSTILSVGTYLSEREEGSAPMYLSMQRENWRYDDVPVAPVIGIAVDSIDPQKLISPMEDNEGWYTIKKPSVIPVVLGEDKKPFLPPYANNLYTDRTAWEGHGSQTKSKQLRKTDKRAYRDAVLVSKGDQWENRSKPLPWSKFYDKES